MRRRTRSLPPVPQCCWPAPRAHHDMTALFDLQDKVIITGTLAELTGAIPTSKWSSMSTLTHSG